MSNKNKTTMILPATFGKPFSSAIYFFEFFVHPIDFCFAICYNPVVTNDHDVSISNKNKKIGRRFS